MKRILVVEDDVSRCLELADLLNEFGFDVGVADTSNRALNMLSEADPLPNLILLDIEMQDGHEFLQQLQMHHVYGKIPIVCMAEGTAFPAAFINKAAVHLTQHEHWVSGVLSQLQ